MRWASRTESPWILPATSTSPITFGTGILKFDPAGNFLLVWGKDVISGGPTGWEVCTVAANCKAGEEGGLGGEFSTAGGVGVAANDDVYVADAIGNRIQVFDTQGNFKRAWGKDVVDGGGTGWELCEDAADCKQGLPGGLGGELEFPVDIDFDSGGLVYVVDNGNMRIQVFDAQGDFQRAWGHDAVNTGGDGPEICTDADQCQVVSPPYGSKGGEFYDPAYLAVGGGSVYVTDSANARVQKFDTLGNFQQAWGKDVISGGPVGYEICTVSADCKAADGGDGLGGEFSELGGLARSAAGEVYVADRGQNRIQVFDSNGDFKRAWGKDVIPGGPIGLEVCTSAPACKYAEDGALGGELLHPEGLALTASGALYVGDGGNYRIQKFAADPPTVSSPTPTPTAAAPKKCKKKKKKKPRVAAKKCKKKKKKR